jgi:hypothetical protein
MEKIGFNSKLPFFIFLLRQPLSKTRLQVVQLIVWACFSGMCFWSEVDVVVANLIDQVPASVSVYFPMTGKVQVNQQFGTQHKRAGKVEKFASQIIFYSKQRKFKFLTNFWCSL